MGCLISLFGILVAMAVVAFLLVKTFFILTTGFFLAFIALSYWASYYVFHQFIADPWLAGALAFVVGSIIVYLGISRFMKDD